MTKLDKAIKILKQRLPKSHFIPVQNYHSVYTLMRSASRSNFNGNYKKCLDWYTEYLTNPEKATYKSTKYYLERNRGVNNRIEGYNIGAIAGNPIQIVYSQIKYRPLREITFLLLHEMGHHYYDRRYNEPLKEDWCDEFAIMWTRRLIKEKII